VNWREFVASLVDSLAWPGAVVVLVVLLRGQLGDLLAGPLRRLKLGPGGAELEWHETVGVVATSVTALPSPRPPSGTPELARQDLDAELNNLERLIDKMPSVALQQTFAVVERELGRIVDERKLERPTNDRRPETLIKAAVHGRVINRETGEALRGLVVLRNLAAHDPSGTKITSEKAAEFMLLARGVLYALLRSPRSD
jgi:hypothetical protein